MTDGNWGGARPGAGRKPRQAGRPRKAISVSVSRDAYEALAGYAERAGKSLSEAADEMLLASAARSPFAPEPPPEGLEVVVPQVVGEPQLEEGLDVNAEGAGL